jgi:hypothetical protein
LAAGRLAPSRLAPPPVARPADTGQSL